MITEILHLAGSRPDLLHPSSVTALTVLPLGFFLGMRHATDPDHVATVTNFVIRKNSVRAAVSIGGLWGLGHTISILAVGLVLVFTRYAIPPQVALFLELLVGAMLIVLGLLNLERFVKWVGNFMPQPPAALGAGPDGGRPVLSSAPRGPSRTERSGLVRPLCVGLVHGLAGSAALTLMVIPILQTPSLALGYLFLFGAGSIAGMIVITAAIALPCARLAERSVLARRHLSTAAGVLGIAFGLFLVFQAATANQPLP